MIRSHNYDLILMDINMPKTNGLEAVKMIREFDETIPIIASASVEFDEMRNEILNPVIRDIIPRPYDVPEFFNIILKCLPSEKVNLPK